MSKVSKTARASMAQTVGQKTVIPDEVYVKNLRNDVASGLYVAQEGAKALLRAYDAALAEIQQLTEKLAGAEATLGDKVIENEGQYKEILAAKEVIANLETEIAAAQAIFGNAAKSTEYTSLEALEAEAKNNHD